MSDTADRVTAPDPLERAREDAERLRAVADVRRAEGKTESAEMFEHAAAIVEAAVGLVEEASKPFNAPGRERAKDALFRAVRGEEEA